MDALDENKKQVKAQVKIIDALEKRGIDPDEYFNKAPRNPVDKKLN